MKKHDGSMGPLWPCICGHAKSIHHIGTAPYYDHCTVSYCPCARYNGWMPGSPVMLLGGSR